MRCLCGRTLKRSVGDSPGVGILRTDQSSDFVVVWLGEALGGVLDAGHDEGEVVDITGGFGRHVELVPDW